MHFFWHLSCRFNSVVERERIMGSIQSRQINFNDFFSGGNTASNFGVSYPSPIKSTSLSRILEQRTRLKNIFSRLQRNKSIHVVCIPSLTFNQEDIKSVLGFKHYETRSLWQVLMAKSSNIKITFVTSVDIQEDVINYYLNLLPNIEEARSRINIFKISDVDQRFSLVENILNNEKNVKGIEKLIDSKESFLLSFMSSEFENELAEKLDIPNWGCLEELSYYQTKSGNREIFEEAKVKYADGYNNISSESELVESILNLKDKYPNAQRFVVKLDHGVSGDGNAIFSFTPKFESLITDTKKAEYIWKRLENMKFQAKDMNWTQFKEKISIGTIVELFLEGSKKTSPSVQGRIHPDGSVEIISTHEQVLDESGMKYLGCVFPAKSEFRSFITHQAYKIGRVMKNKGISGYFAVDFLVFSNKGKRESSVIEINVRQGGTTHPYQTAKLLTDSKYYVASGLLINPEGKPVYYRSNDNLILENPQNDPQAFLDYMQSNGIFFDKEKKIGAVFHLLSALEDYGKVGYTVIGHDLESVEKISNKIIKLSKNFK